MQFKSEHAQEADPALIPFWSLKKIKRALAGMTHSYYELVLKDIKINLQDGECFSPPFCSPDLSF